MFAGMCHNGEWEIRVNRQSFKMHDWRALYDEKLYDFVASDRLGSILYFINEHNLDVPRAFALAFDDVSGFEFILAHRRMSRIMSNFDNFLWSSIDMMMEEVVNDFHNFLWTWTEPPTTLELMEVQMVSQMSFEDQLNYLRCKLASSRRK